MNLRIDRRFSGQVTPAQQAILDLLVQGMSNLNIAANLDLEEDTIKRQLQYIFGKFSVSSRLDLAVTVLRERHAKELEALKREHENHIALLRREFMQLLHGKE